MEATRHRRPDTGGWHLASIRLSVGLWREGASRGAKVPVNIRFHPHAMERMQERGATEDEVRAAIENGERIAAKYGRIGFRRNFPFDGEWQGRRYANKQLEVYAVEEQGWLVITVIVKYF